MIDDASTGDPDIDALTTPDTRNRSADDGVGGGDEGMARRLGWTAKDKFRGPAHKWLPADEFVAKVEKETPVLRERLRNQDKEAQRRDREISELRAQLAEQNKTTKEILERQRANDERSFGRTRAEIEAEMDRAASEADTATYNRAKVALAELDKQRPKPVAEEPAKAGGAAAADTTKGGTQTGNLLPETQEWIERNTWFKANVSMRQWAQGREVELTTEFPTMTTIERLEMIEDEAKKLFPAKFDNPRRNAPGAVSGSAPPRNGAGKGNGKKTFADLDEHAKAAFQRIAARTPGYTQEEYLKSYKW